MNVNVAVNKSYSSLRLLDQLSQDFKGAVDLAVKENGLRGPFGIMGFRISEHLLEAFVGTMPILNLAIFHHVYSLQESGTVGIKRRMSTNASMIVMFVGTAVSLL